MKTIIMLLVIGFVSLVAFTFVLGYNYDQALHLNTSLLTLAEKQQCEIQAALKYIERQKLTLELYKDLLKQSITVEGHIIEEPTH